MKHRASESISIAVEGLADAAVARRLVEHVGAVPGHVYGQSGKAALRERIRNYASASRFSPWLVLVDLDHDEACASALIAAWLGSIPPGLCLRVAVREIESWLLADRDEIAEFLGVPTRRIPADPDSIAEPKHTLVAIAARSRRGDVRRDMVPTERSARAVGRAYTSRLIEFAERLWQPARAASNSASLASAIACLRRLADR